MGVEDLQPGMKFTVTLEDSSNYHGDIVERTENTLTVSLGNFHRSLKRQNANYK